MNNVLVLGATGGMGSALTYELAKRGVHTIAFARNKQKLEEFFHAEALVTIQAGDVFNEVELNEAMKKVDIVFHAINLPYEEWADKLEDVMDRILQGCQRNGAKLAIVDNIYAYGINNNQNPLTETATKQPQTKKGKVRLRLQQKALNSNVPVVIAHFPDFYGPNAENTGMHYMLQNMVRNKRAMFVGSQTIPREYIYTMDGAKALIELAYTESAYGQCWNIPGARAISGEEVIQIVKEITGYTKKVSTVSKNMVRFIGLFDKSMREYVEMYELNDNPVFLDGQKYQREIGDVPKTPYEEGLKHTLTIMEAKKG
ncbi:SDR family NAD(P)-dependent oxidoreductase [Metabacillus sp. HB246100]|uniref:SDR family NAD(P)-dependent oxidoreductase n=1 Tax=Bacillus weihaiensis TaxID=1547283 RepID=UPI002352CBFC|nr:SDR family NAD(P)-dependent oxidoreductase [Bacillus weihaiensis]